MAMEETTKTLQQQFDEKSREIDDIRRREPWDMTAMCALAIASGELTDITAKINNAAQLKQRAEALRCRELGLSPQGMMPIEPLADAELSNKRENSA